LQVLDGDTIAALGQRFAAAHGQPAELEALEKELEERCAAAPLTGPIPSKA
jgi:hypothetical protein